MKEEDAVTQIAPSFTLDCLARPRLIYNLHRLIATSEACEDRSTRIQDHGHGVMRPRARTFAGLLVWVITVQPIFVHVPCYDHTCAAILGELCFGSGEV